MKITPAVGIPSLDTLGKYDIGAWLWSKKTDDRSHFVDEHVWIERRCGFWFAGWEQEGACVTGCVWIDDGASKPGELVRLTGSKGDIIDASLAPSKKTPRVWDLLSVAAITMVPRITMGRDEVAMTAENMGLLSANELLDRWSQKN